MALTFEKRESSGFRRMKERLGAEKFEALRQDTLRMQREALDAVPRTTTPITGSLHDVVRDVIRGKRK
jgi:hypothetical protein